MSGIGIITNPHSKLNKRNPKRQKLLGFIVGEHGRLEITNSLKDLGRVAQEFLDHDIEILAINGGDGTISRTLTAFTHAYGAKPLPKVAILRGGTINVLAENLGVKGTPEQILYRLTEAFSQGNDFDTKTLSTLNVESNIGFLFGNGTVPLFLREYYKRKSGPIGAAFWAFRVWVSRFLGGKLYSSVVQDQRNHLEPQGSASILHRSIAVFCATIPKMPLNYPLFNQIGQSLGVFQVVSFTFSAKDAIWKLPKTLLRPKLKSSKTKLSLLTSKMDLSLPKAFGYTLDGEIFTSKQEKLTLSLGPNIQFIVI